MSRPRQSQPSPTSVPGRLARCLADHRQHDAADLRGRLNASRGTLASALHALEYRYGYAIERGSNGGRAWYRLGASISASLRTGDVLTILAIADRGRDADIKARDSRGKEWSLRAQVVEQSA